MSESDVWTRLRAEKEAKEAAKRAKAAEPVPSPSVLARPATEEEIGDGRSARRQALKAATKHDWTATLTYSRGPLLGGNSEVMDPDAEVLVLRADKPGRGVRAIWVRRSNTANPSWGFGSGWAGSTDAGLRALSGDEVKKELAA